MSNHVMDADSIAFVNGQEDGYMGYVKREGQREAYYDGYSAGVAQYNADVEEAEYSDYEADAYYFSAVEQGMYDDDPSPYNGDY